MKVRKQKVLDALDWLKANNRLYKDIDIDYAVDLPEDGTIYDVPGLELIEPDEADKMEKVLPESEKQNQQEAKKKAEDSHLQTKDEQVGRNLLGQDPTYFVIPEGEKESTETKLRDLVNLRPYESITAKDFKEVSNNRLRQLLGDKPLTEWKIKDYSGLSFPWLFPRAENCIFDDIKPYKAEHMPSAWMKLRRLVRHCDKVVDKEGNMTHRQRFVEMSISYSMPSLEFSERKINTKAD